MHVFFGYYNFLSDFFIHTAKSSDSPSGGETIQKPYVVNITWWWCCQVALLLSSIQRSFSLLVVSDYFIKNFYLKIVNFVFSLLTIRSVSFNYYGNISAWLWINMAQGWLRVSFWIALEIFPKIFFCPQNSTYWCFFLYILI